MDSKLTRQAQFSLFISSYAPLFLIIVLRQISHNIPYLHWGGWSFEAFLTLIRCFGLSIVLAPLTVIGFWGLHKLMGRLQERVKSGSDVTVVDVKNKSGEAISYIGTYIIPFIFNDFSSMIDSVSMVILLTLIYSIYSNTSMVLINPILNLKYPIYEANLKFSDSEKTCLVIIQSCSLEEGDNIRVYKIGHKLYFGKTKEKK